MPAYFTEFPESYITNEVNSSSKLLTDCFYNFERAEKVCFIRYIKIDLHHTEVASKEHDV